MKNQLIYFEPYVFASCKENDVIIYNTLSGGKLVYNNKSISKFVLSMTSASSNFVYAFSKEELETDTYLQSFIHDVREGFFGDIVNVSFSKKTPLPINNMNIPRVKDLPDANNISNSKGDFENLKEIYFYLNNKYNLKTIYSEVYKQTIWSYYSEDRYLETEKNRLFELIGSLNGTRVRMAHFLGGNLLMLSYLHAFIKFLSLLKCIKVFYFNISDILSSKNDLDLFKELKDTKIILLYDLSTSAFELVKILEGFNPDQISIKFIVRNDEELSKCIDIQENCSIKNYTISPVYDGHNKAFFAENVFFTKSKLLHTAPNNKLINLKLSINPGAYGKLHVLPDFDVYSDLCLPKLGNLKENMLSHFISKELRSKNCWNKTRFDVMPCADCIYCFLCPSISSFEYLIKDHKVCND